MNRSKFSFNYFYLFIIIISALIIVGGCSVPVDDEGFYLIHPVDDPMILDYRFVPSTKVYAVESDHYVLLDFNGDTP